MGGAEDNEIEKRIKEDILKSGFPLEIRVSTDLERHGYHISPNVRYALAEEKEHEIDVLAIKPFVAKMMVDSEGVDAQCFVCLVIECKKSTDKPWIFFNRARTAADIPRKLFNVVSNCGVNKAFTIKDGSHSLFDILDLSLLHFFQNNKKSTTFTVAFTQAEKDRSKQIYDAINSVMNGLDWKCIEKRNSLWKDVRFAAPVIWFYYPVIVLEGDLFEATVTDHDLDISRAFRTHVIFHSEKSSTKELIIDIRKKEDFAHFLSNIDDDVKILQSKLGNIELMRRK